MNNYLDIILLTICNKLQLSESKYELATERYRTISNIIQSDPVFENIELNMYAHGSFRLKTTVKPLEGEEYDLDFVVEISANTIGNMTPNELYNHIYRILSKDGKHNGMVEKKSRCIRVNYANDFHLDIMPGKQIFCGKNEILVPDRELSQWYHHSNPIDYADWFEGQARKGIISEIQNLRKIQCSTEPIEEQEIVTRLEPLRRAVQLIKRYRDVYCDKYNAKSVRSIIICTLMGEITSTYSDTLQIITDFCKYVKSKNNMSYGNPFEVHNPVVDELLTEKWEEDSQNYTDFINMVKELEMDVIQLRNKNINREIDLLLKKMFGETITNDAIKEYAKVISENRNKGALAVDSKGRLNAIGQGKTVKKNTFYGD